MEAYTQSRLYQSLVQEQENIKKVCNHYYCHVITKITSLESRMNDLFQQAIQMEKDDIGVQNSREYEQTTEQLEHYAKPCEHLYDMLMIVSDDFFDYEEMIWDYLEEITPTKEIKTFLHDVKRGKNDFEQLFNDYLTFCNEIDLLLQKLRIILNNKVEN